MHRLHRILAYSLFSSALATGGCSSSSSHPPGGGDMAAGGQGGNGSDMSMPPPVDLAGADLANGGRPAKANVVFVLTDDLAWNLVPYMKNVKQMQKDGITFTRYFVTDSLCCPSRSTIFTGKYPHDTQVFTNDAQTGGYQKFESAGNAAHTFAVALTNAGYHTAMMGKYLNGYLPDMNQADPGWSEWDVAGDGYKEFNYTLNQNGTLVPYGNADADYLVDVQNKLANQFIVQQGAQPFLIEVATFAPHGPYVMAPRYRNTSNEKAPRTPAFNVANANPPAWLAAQALSAADINTIDTDFNKRVEAVQAVDDMIGAIFTTLKAQGIDKNTYVVFSSDNGFHMGEHKLFEGKQTAFDTDINVPLIVVGPGVPAGAVEDRIVENIDLCPTFAELGGTTPAADADGHSLVSLIHGQNVTDWRNVALIEHHGPDFQPMAIDDPDNDEVHYRPAATGDMGATAHPMPTSYEAIRMPQSVFVSYSSGETEYYDLKSDPNELTNSAATLTAAQVKSLQGTLTAIKNCHGAAQCWQAEHR